jgi:hypothetical protein
MEIVMPVATGKIMVPHAVPKKNKFQWHSHLFGLKIDTQGYNLHSIFFNLIFCPNQQVKFLLYVTHSMSLELFVAI